ncbi:cytochrome P450 [Phytohabitans suffuscus]|uniref:Cytochrome P450 n=1 Tax=Phytohabitans suffuscus TaxID=624315 RepID=A0A6F8Y9X9_9ACTN|nr:cytochrome P450 [Phytohabitans suffuscus]BCB82833.1 cytochrome P450 [Phytohabitans suffuscus]
MTLPTVSDLAEQVRQLFAGDPRALADPYPVWNRLRDELPVTRIGDAVVLSRHSDVKTLLGDNHHLYSRARTKHSARYEHARQAFSPSGRAAFDRVLDHEFKQLVRLDPPDHPRVRRVVTPPFSARALKSEMEEKIRHRVGQAMDDIAGRRGAVDFKQVAYTLPLRVLGDLLGIPLHDLDRIHSWAFRIAENKLNADSEEKSLAADDAYRDLMGYIDELVERQTASGSTTGLVASLLEAQSGGVVDGEEVRAMLALMIFAGHETTSNLLAIGMMGLLEHRDQWDLLVADPSRAPAAVEELLRFVTPAHFLQYVAAQRRELDGVVIEAGDTVIGVLAAANRDPEVFAEPDRLDVTRPDSRFHVSLGLGPHFCLGAGLARMEAVALFAAMAERFPGARLTGEELVWGGRSLRTPIRLPILARP